MRPPNYSPGGADGVRTHAPVTRPNGLANRPLEPLGYCSSEKYYNIIFILIKYKDDYNGNNEISDSSLYIHWSIYCCFYSSISISHK